jgi:hypothetical protein
MISGTAKRGMSLRARAVLLLGVLMSAVLAAIILRATVLHRADLDEQLIEGARATASAVHAGMLFPMMEGDGAVVRTQLAAMKNDLRGGEVVVYGHQKRTAIYATRPELEGVDLREGLRAAPLQSALERALLTGQGSSDAFQETRDGRRYITVLRTMPNDAACQHCHKEAHEQFGAVVLVRWDVEQAYQALTSETRWDAAWGLLACLMVVGIVALLVSRVIIQPVTQVLGRLSEDSDAVLHSADATAATSRSVAEGASEQARNLAEVTETLEHITTATSTNVDSSLKAEALLKGAHDAASHANQDMSALTQAMVDISAASQATSAVVKSIDEIAFQTGILALNAAVEASRAGESGAGFAVVAAEVRALALRAAVAAKDTSSRIQATVDRVNAGVDLVRRTGRDFEELTKRTSEAAVLSEHIAVASREQAQRIATANDAVARIDRIVQANAAAAEQTSSAAIELDQMAGAMKHAVDELERVVN